MSFCTAIVIIVALGVFADILKTRHRAQAGITRDWKGGEVVAAGNDRALEREVAELRERVKVLERIATEDRDTKLLSAEIERLRDKQA